MSDTQRPERVLTDDGRTVLVAVELFDQMESALASLTTRLDRCSEQYDKMKAIHETAIRPLTTRLEQAEEALRCIRDGPEWREGHPVDIARAYFTACALSTAEPTKGERCPNIYCKDGFDVMNHEPCRSSGHTKGEPEITDAGQGE